MAQSSREAHGYREPSTKLHSIALRLALLSTVARCFCSAADSTEQASDFDSAADDGPEVVNGVSVLTSDNFNDVLMKYPISLINFYADDVYSKELSPKFERAAEKLSNYSSVMLLAKVDCNTEYELRVQNNVTAAPTLLLFHFNEFFRHFEGEHEEEDLVMFMEAIVDGTSYRFAYLRAFSAYKQRIRVLPISDWLKEHIINAFPWTLIPLLALPYLLIWCVFGESSRSPSDTNVSKPDVPSKERATTKKSQRKKKD
eukprot:TRINITY_DN71327_c0_g1_i1.p1 TRINITY_DN71327_c0_g1~~TRINITY_DN71327_c0_g1_i1.p1  ORF type:complete len:257 (+),score=36.73 TRINITY_DN71327_c0_g1_i1:36-806(+)